MGKTYEKVLEFKVLLKKFLKYSKASQHISCKTVEIIRLFKKDVNGVKEGLVRQDQEALKSISLFKNITFEKIHWNYLYEMYNTSLEDNESHLEIDIIEIPKVPQVNPSRAMPADMASLLSNPAIGNMIQELVPMVQESLKDKDLSNIDPSQLLGVLTSGNLKNNDTGIDFTDIVGKTSKLVAERIASGDIKK
jgi:hypothetical protein